MKKLIFYGIPTIFFTTFFLAAIFWWQIRTPINSEGGAVVFKVNKGDSAKIIANNLFKSGLIKNQFIFQLYSFLSLRQFALKPGEYEFSPKMSVRDIADTLALGGINEIFITIPEGFSLKQIEQRLVSANLIKLNELSNFKYSDNIPPILLDKPKSASLEGYLFPDSYRFFKDASLLDIVSKMVGNFDKKLTLDLKMSIKSSPYSLYEVLTVASLIEKEVVKDSDRSIVSGILWKRLGAKIPLQVDATLVYITGRKEVYEADKKINSPYNTYFYRGLPKGPIDSPGLSAIKAAIFPEPSPYWFYLSTKDGATIFSKTLEEHNRNKAIYLK